MCNDINIVKLGFEKQPKLTKEQPILNFSILSKTVDTIRTKFSTVILNHNEVLSKTTCDSNENFYILFTLCGGRMCAMFLTLYGWYLRNVAEIDQGTANCELFSFLFKHSLTIRTKISTAILHFMGELCVQ